MWKASLRGTLLVLGAIFAYYGFEGYATFRAATLWFLLQQHAYAIGAFVVALGANIYAGFFYLTRKLFLRDTGSKLVHLEKQLRDGSLPHELGTQLVRRG